MLEHLNVKNRRIQYIVCALLIYNAHIEVAFAQTFELVPNDSISTSGWLEDNFDLTIEQRNITQDTLSLAWELVSQTVPVQWEASVCDNSFCYTTLAPGGMMAPVAPGSSGKLLIRLTPHVTPGKAIVRYSVWDTSAPTARDTLTYTLNAGSTTNVTEGEPPWALCDFDHTAQVVNVRTATMEMFSIQLYNASGELIAASNRNQSYTQVSVHEHPTGLYVLLVVSESRTIRYHFLKR